MITSANILDISEALATAAALATNVDWVIPSPFGFQNKADFWAAYDDANNTKTEIETTLIRALWFRYLNFEDEGNTDEDAREIEGPLRTLIFEGTLFNELKPFQRLDETVTPDAFNKTILKTNHEHVTALMSIVGQFQGVISIPALAPSSFAVAETITPAQLDNSQFNVACDYIPGCFGDQTKIELRVRVQIPC